VNLFAYGTLMDRRTIARITGRSLPAGVPAVLHGYRKLETSLGYPIVLPEAGATTQGVVYFGLGYSDWEKLDRYENLYDSPPAYIRRLVQVQGSHGTINAFVYVGNLQFFRTRIRR